MLVSFENSGMKSVVGQKSGIDTKVRYFTVNFNPCVRVFHCARGVVTPNTTGNNLRIWLRFTWWTLGGVDHAKFEPERSLARLEALPARLPPPPRMIRPLLPTKLAGKVPTNNLSIASTIAGATDFEKCHRARSRVTVGWEQLCVTDQSGAAGGGGALPHRALLTPHDMVNHFSNRGPTSTFLKVRVMKVLIPRFPCLHTSRYQISDIRCKWCIEAAAHRSCPLHAPNSPAERQNFGRRLAIISRPRCVQM